MKKFLLIAFAAVASTSAFAQSFTEGFEGCATPGNTSAIGPLPGWTVLNESTSPTATHGGWFSQTVAGPFGPNSGNVYAASNWSSVSTGVGTNNNWLIAPTRTLNNGDTISFWTRSVNSSFPDRMYVKLSLSGSSSNTANFTTTLLAINPNLAPQGYGTVGAWTFYSITLSGLGGPTSGRFAFNYNVTNGGPSGANADFIGVDDVSYTAVPEPATMAALGLGAAALIRRRRK